MSEEKYSIEGKFVTIFTVGPFEFSGMVEYASKDKIVLTKLGGSLVIYRDKIVGAIIIEDIKLEDSIDDIEPERYEYSPEEEDVGDIEEQSSYYGSVIPEDMLVGESTEPPVSFSFSLSDLKNARKKGEGYGSSEEARKDRGED